MLSANECLGLSVVFRSAKSFRLSSAISWFPEHSFGMNFHVFASLNHMMVCDDVSCHLKHRNQNLTQPCKYHQSFHLDLI